MFGGLPGQSAYYTDAATLSASGGIRTALFESLQVRPDPVLGLRSSVGEYEVVRDIRVPFGSVRANPSYGFGGGNQFFVGGHANSLRLVREIPLGK